MVKTKNKNKKAPSIRKRYMSIILIAFTLLLGGIFIYISSNFNSILSNKIYSIYRQSEMETYYSLHFKKLRVNLISMSVRIYGVSLKPKTEEQKVFFEQNGSINIFVGKIVLKDASIFDFISSNNISVKEFSLKDSRINIYKQNELFQPFAFIKKETTNDSLHLKVSIVEMNINHAQLHYYTGPHEREENSFDDFNMKVDSIAFDSKKSSFDFSFNKLIASLNQGKYIGKKQVQVSFENYEVKVSQFAIIRTKGQFNFDFKNLSFLITDPKFITSDSVYTISSKSIFIDKSNKILKIDKFNLHPNLTKAQFVKKHKYQNLRSELDIENAYLTNIDFDRLIDNQGLFADSLIITGAKANLYKSKSKGINKKVIPDYLALQIRKINYPLAIKVVTTKDAEITFKVKQKNGQMSHVTINQLSGDLTNVQNESKAQKLRLDASGMLEEKLPFSVTLVFNYDKNRFTYQGVVNRSNIKSISKMVHSFAPIEIDNGIIDKLKFSGVATRAQSRGRMTFLYHDLEIRFQGKAKSKGSNIGNAIISLAANTYVFSNNPKSPNVPPRNVNFSLNRDMNKGFIDILVKSILKGAKETLVPSRENRKRYKQAKNKAI
jgi:hypothetical protein